MTIFDWIFEIGAVRRNANLVDLEKCRKIHRRYAQKGCTVSNTKHRSRASVIAYVWMWEVMGVKRSQRRWREVNQTAPPNLEWVKKRQQMWTDVNNNAFPNLEGNRRGKRRSTKLQKRGFRDGPWVNVRENRHEGMSSGKRRRGQQNSTEANRSQAVDLRWPLLTCTWV